MKVRELIERLQQCDPELRVMVEGYEGGVTDAEFVLSTTVALNYNKEYYYGPHEIVTPHWLTDEEKQTYEVVNVIYLPR